MNSVEINAKRAQLSNLLSKLALSENLLSDKTERIKIYKELESIYQQSDDDNGFRHYYSDIFAKVFEIKSDATLSNGTLETLMYNLQFINDHYMSKSTDKNGKSINVSKNIHKLYDHVSLEIARMSYSDKGDVWVAQQGATLMNLSNKVEEIQEDAKNIRDSVEKSKLDYIAILGIFASVVLAFVGGMAFSTSVLENINDVSIYRLLTVALIIGMVFVTVIFLMFYFIGVLTGRILNDEQSIEPLRLSYIVFFALIVFVFVMWCLGIVETRNDTVKKNFESIEMSDTSDVTEQIEFETNSAAIE